MKALTPKQQRFVQEFLVDGNATQSACRAGYSKANADKIGSELLGKTRIAEAIARAQDERAKRTGITADRVVAGLLREAEYFGDGASASARVSAWTALGKHLGMFVERVKVEAERPAPDLSQLTYAQLNLILAAFETPAGLPDGDPGPVPVGVGGTGHPS